MPSRVQLPNNVVRRSAKYFLKNIGLEPIVRRALGKPPAKALAKKGNVASKKAPTKGKVAPKKAPTNDITVKAVLSYMDAMLVRRPSLHAPVVLYFEGTMANWYQLEMWLSILNKLNQVVPVSLVIRNQSVFRRVVSVTNFQVILCITIDDLMKVYENSDIKCILYVNHAAKNFQSLINKDVLHVHINHGESDKLSTITNQATAYDYVYVVGDAAWERYETNLLRKDMSRFVRVGRPQLEHIAPIAPDVITFLEMQSDTPKKVVLYAPTWEGTHQSMNYSSIPEIGVNLVKTLLDDPGYRVIYKAHPNTGSRDDATSIAHQEIIKLLKDHEDGLNVVGGDINAIYPTIDIPIFDNSTVTIDYLTQNRPFLLTDLFHRAVGLSEQPPILSAGCVVNSRDIKSISDIIKYQLFSDPLSKVRSEVKSYYLGNFNYTAQESTQAFIEHIQSVILERDNLMSERNEAVKPTSLFPTA